MFASREQDIEFALRWMRRNTACEFDQLVGHSRHGRDDRYNTATFSLRLNDSTRHVTNSLRSRYRSAAIFLNNQTHVINRLRNTNAKFQNKPLRGLRCS